MGLTNWQRYQQMQKKGSVGNYPPTGSFSAINDEEEERRRRREASQRMYAQYAAETGRPSWDMYKQNNGRDVDNINLMDVRAIQQNNMDTQMAQARTEREARAAMMPELEAKKNNGGMTPDEELLYARGQIEALSDGEQKAMSMIREGQDQNFSDNSKYVYDDKSGTGLGRMVVDKYFRGDKAIGTGDKQIKEAQDILKNQYGWDDEKIEQYTLMSERLANNYGTKAAEKQFAIDKNGSTGAKIGKSVLNTATDIVNAPVEGTMGILSNLSDRPEGFGRDTNHVIGLPSNLSEEATRQVVDNAITDKHKIGQQAYQIGLSTAESGYLAALGGSLGAGAGGIKGALGQAATLTPFATGAYNSGYKEARDRGATEKQAQLYGIAAGGAEAGTEILSLDHLWDMAKGTKIGKQIVIDWLAQAGIEGSEEAASDLLNRYSDYLILGKDGKNAMTYAIDDYVSKGYTRQQASKMANIDFWKQVGMDALGGAISGGVLGAGGLVAGNINAHENKQRAKEISGAFSDAKVEGNSEFETNFKQDADKYAKNPTQYLVDTMDDSTAEGKKRKAELQKLADKEAAGKKLSTSDRNYIEQSLWVAENEAQNSKESMDAREAYNGYVKDMSAVPNEYRTAVTNITEEQAREELGKAAAEGDIESLGETYQKMKNAKSAEVRSKADEIYNSYAGMAESHGVTKEQIEGFKVSEQEAYSAALKGKNQAEIGNMSKKSAEAFRAGQLEYKNNVDSSVVSNKNANVVTNEGKKATLSGVFSDDGNVITSDGKTIAVSDIKMENVADQKAYGYADTQPSVAAKNAYISGIKEGTNLEQYNIAWKNYFRAGRTGLDFSKESQTGKGKLYADALGKDTVKAMYDAGVAQTQFENSKKAKDELNKAFNVKKGSGVFEDTRADKSDKMDTEVLRVMAGVSGLNIRLVDDTKVKDGVNAYFDPNTSTVVVGSHASAQAFHEVIGEFTEMYNSEGYEKMRTAAMEASKEVLGTDQFNRVMDSYAAAYGKAGESNTDMEMSTEMTNDFAVAVMSTDKGRQAFTKYLVENSTQKEAKTLKDKIVNLYHSIIKSIKNLLSRSNLMGYQKKLLNDGTKQLEQNVDLFIKEWDNAVKNYRDEIVGRDNSTMPDIVKYSIDVSDIDTDDDIYFRIGMIPENGRSINWLSMSHDTNDDVSYYLKNGDIEEVRKLLKGENYEEGISTWKVDKNGNADIRNLYGLKTLSGLIKDGKELNIFNADFVKQGTDNEAVIKNPKNIVTIELTDEIKDKIGYYIYSKLKENYAHSSGDYKYDNEKIYRGFDDTKGKVVTTFAGVTFEDPIGEFEKERQFKEKKNTEKLDTDKNKLSDDQIKFFEYSKIRGIFARLTPMYYGIEKPGVGFYFTEKPLKSKKDTQELNKSYLNIKNPYKICAYGKHWDKLHTTYGGDVEQFHNLTISRGIDGNIEAEWHDDNNKKTSKVFNEEELSAKFGDNLIDMLNTSSGSLNITNYVIDKDTHAQVISTPMDAAYYATQHGYDGVLIWNVDNSGLFSKSKKENVSNIVIAFDTDQIKATDDLHPDDKSKKYSMDIQYTDERIDDLIESYGASNPKYSQAYVATINPRDFLKLTLRDEILDKWNVTVGSEEHPEMFKLDKEELKRESQTPYLVLDSDTMEIDGHEGRHRMRALMEAGITEAPVVIVDYGTKMSKEKTDTMSFTSQDFGSGNVNGGYIATVRNLIPVNNVYRDDIKSSYGQDADIKFSINVDSEGNELSQGQKEYFKGTKAVDENGTLKVMYHGTSDTGFTVFDSSNSDDGISLFFTDDLTVAKGYSGTSDEYIPDKKLSVKEMNEKISDGNYFVREDNGKYELVHRHYGEENTEYSGSYDEMMDYITEEFTGGDYGAGNYKVYLNTKKPYVIDAKGKGWNELYELYGGDKIRYNDFNARFTDDGIAVECYDIDNSIDIDDVFSKEEFIEKFGSEVYKALEMDGKKIWKKDHIIDAKTHEQVISSTREAAQYAKENGYDGLIIKNVYDTGLYASSREYKPSTVMVVFNPEQVKSVANKNPTSNEDIRYSLNIENDEFFDIFNGEPEEEESFTSGVSILEEGMALLKNKEVDTKAIRSIANKLKKEYASTVKLEALTSDLEKVFAYMQTEDHVNYNDMMRILNEVARPVVEASNNVSPEEKELYDSFINSMKNHKLRLTDMQKQEVTNSFGSYGEFRRMMMPINISNNGTEDLESAWAEIAAESGGVLDADLNEGDMPGALYDALTAMKPTPHNDFGGDIDNVSKDLAMRIVEEYLGSSNDAAVKKIADKMRQQNAEYRSKLRNRYSERLRETKKDLKEKYAEKGQKYDEKIAELKAKNKEAATEARNKRLAYHEKQMIAKEANALITWVANPSEKNHVPRDLVEPVTEFLYALDFVEPDVKQNQKGGWYVRVFDHSVINSDGSRSMEFKTLTGNTREEVLQKFYDEINGGMGSQNTIKWYDRMQQVKDLLNQVKTGEQFEHSSMDDFLQTIDPSLADEFSEMLKENKGTANINQLGYKDLNIINKTLKGITHAIRQGNKAFTQDATIETLATKTMDYSKTIKESKPHSKAYEKIRKTLRLDMANPSTYFSLNGADSVYKSLRTGFNKKVADIRAAQDYMKGVMQGVSKKELNSWTGNKSQIHEFNVNGGTIRLTTAQIMSLYELSKRQQAMLHLAGGLKADRIVQGMKVYNQENPVHMTALQISQITDTLTKKQKQIADAMQKYMASECARQGNEAAMLMYGYEKFTDKNYFPISTDKTTVSTNNSNITNETLNSIERSGFTKQLKKQASNPILIKDIFDVFTNHVSDMATYHGYAPAIKDANRWFNFRKVDKEDEFKYYSTVKQAINVLSGNRGSDYFITLMKDINGSEKSQDVGNVFDFLIPNYKAAAVGANIRVIIQQPTAYFRAMNEIDPKYLFTVTPKQAVEAGKKMREQSEICWWKSQGYYETSIGQSMKQIITGQSTTLEKVKDVSMSGAGLADDLTWGVLYGAVTKEQKALAKGENISEEELDMRIKDRFDEVVDKTQVVDSTLHRSQYMRSKGLLTKIQTAFMAEPTKSYNMLMEAAVKDAREGKTMKRTSKAAITFTLTSIVTAAAASLIDAMRRDSDDKDWGEIYKEALLENIADNVNPLNMIPVVKDFYNHFENMLKGDAYFNSSNRMDMDAVTSLLDAGNSIIKAFNGESNKTIYGNILTIMRPLSQVTGLSVYNLTKDCVSLYNEFFPDIQKTVSSSKYAGVYDAIKTGRGIDKAVEKAIQNGGTIKDIRSGITSRYKNDYRETMQVDEELADDIAKEAKAGLLATGMSEAEANEEIEGWKEETFSYKEIDDAIETGENIPEAVKKAMEFKDPDKIKEHIVKRYGSTLDYQEENAEANNGLKANANKALGIIDPGSTFDSTEREMEEAQQQKEAAAELKAERESYKNIVFDAVGTGRGDWKKAIEDLAGTGTEYSDVKSYLTSQYKKQFIEDYNNGKDVSATASRIATMKAYCDEKSGTKIPKKYGGNYYEYEIEKIKDWLDPNKQ